ncbi:MAG: peptidoglycan DD-metalloendopeptidase family protein [Bacillota bacterium]|jgi:murein DD-endopeptidase MepM/ murein hydrolase activator NlpD
MGEDGEKIPRRRNRQVQPRHRFARVLFVAVACLTLFGSGVYLGLTSLSRDQSPVAQTKPGGTEDNGVVATIGDKSSPASPSSNSDTSSDQAGTNDGDDCTVITVDTTDNGEYLDALEAVAIPVDLSQLSWPTSGEIRHEPGWSYSDTLGAWRYVSGVTIRGESGRDVCAALAGVVQEVLDDPVDGKGIVLSHGPNLETRYYGIRVALCAQGDQIAQGDVIARLQGPDLVFEVRRNGEALNPANYLGQVR